MKFRCFVVNVYSKGPLSEKRKMWSELVRLKNSLDVVGDFNSVLDGHERRHGVGDRMTEDDIEIREFRNFVSQMELVDFPILRRCFTWFQPSGRAMSRLDQFLISKG
jgi:hypothetical protein